MALQDCLIIMRVASISFQPYYRFYEIPFTFDDTLQQRLRGQSTILIRIRAELLSP